MPPTLVEVGGEMSGLDHQPSANDVPIPESQLNIKPRQIGVWDLFEDMSPDPPPIQRLAMLLEGWRELASALPFVIRMARDVYNIPDCSHLVIGYLTIELIQAFIPAISIW